MNNNKNSNTSAPKTSLLFVTGVMVLVVFMTSFTAIVPTTAQTAPAVILPTGQWEIHENGNIGTLTIDNIGADGIVTGRLQVPPNPPHTITGLYNERNGTLTLHRIINQQDPSSVQTYVGFVFRDGSPFAGIPDRMAGYFIGLPAGGGSQEQNIWGWYAILNSTAVGEVDNAAPLQGSGSGTGGGGGGGQGTGGGGGGGQGTGGGDDDSGGDEEGTDGTEPETDS